jgi:hypothetical protein
MLNLDEYHRKDVGPRMEEHFELQPAQPCHVEATPHVTRLLLSSSMSLFVVSSFVGPRLLFCLDLEVIFGVGIAMRGIDCKGKCLDWENVLSL